jgi:hypothetical protein
MKRSAGVITYSSKVLLKFQALFQSGLGTADYALSRVVQATMDD